MGLLLTENRYSMKNHILSIFLGIALLAVTLVSCNDNWNSHFDRSEDLPDENLWEIICNDASLSSFAKIVKTTGYDSLLTSTQTYTVWAPVNEALADVDMDDKEELLRIVVNHIARHSNSTAMPAGKGVTMLNGKKLSFTHGDTPEFGDAELLNTDCLASNGILHTVSQVIPYAYNLYEYAQTHPDYSKFYEFVSSFNTMVVSEELSTPLEIVYEEYNPLLESIYGIGAIHDEDSTYTMILPDNAAWDKAYELISPYFKAPVTEQGEEYADSLQRIQTSLAIVNSLVYRKEIEEPFAQYDSLVSTTGTVIHDVPALFAGASLVKGSNGNIYTTSSINYDPLDTWNPEIIIECEGETEREVTGGAMAFVRTVSVDDLFTDVSGNSYLEVTGSKAASITFSIPNVLSGKYEVWVDFVPPIVDGAEFETEKAEIEGGFKCMKEDGTTPKNYSYTSKKAQAVTGSEKVQVMVIPSKVTIPVANYYDNMWWAQSAHVATDAKATTTLTVLAEQSNKKGTVAKFRIDRIRLVPVN